MRAKLPPLVPLFLALLLTVLPGPVRGDTVVPFGTIYADVPLDARVVPEFPNRLRALVAQVNGLGAPLVSYNLDDTRMRLCFRAGPAPTTMEAIAPVVQALQQSGLISQVYPVEIGIPGFGGSLGPLAELADNVLRGDVGPTVAPFLAGDTRSPHYPGFLTVYIRPFLLAGPNRAATVAAVAADCAAISLRFTPSASSGDPYSRLNIAYDPNRVGLIEVIRRLRATTWGTSAATEPSVFPAVVTPAVTQHWLLSGQARPGAPFETFLVSTHSSLGGIGTTLGIYLRSQAFVPLSVSIAPREASDLPIPGLERYALPWVVRSINAVGFADFGAPDFQGSRNSPRYTAAPSEISADVAGWINANQNTLWTQNFRVVAEVSAAESNLGNTSARAQVGRGERIVIGGFQVKGGSTRRLIIRGIGPSLSAFGIANPLPNPKIAVYTDGAPFTENDDWQTGARAEELQARYPQYVPLDPRESAVLGTFPPGNYTILLSGAGNEEGVAVFELYDAPEQP